jgi:hypothetical protein
MHTNALPLIFLCPIHESTASGDLRTCRKTNNVLTQDLTLNLYGVSSMCLALGLPLSHNNSVRRTCTLMLWLMQPLLPGNKSRRHCIDS